MEKQMPTTSNSRARRITGWAAIFAAGLLSLFTWYQSRVATTNVRAQIALADRQLQIADALAVSDNYPAVIVAQDGEIIHWNDAMEKLTGVTCDMACKLGLDAIMCDKMKALKHTEGMQRAFQGPPNSQKLILVQCEIWDAKNRRTPVQVSVRIHSLSNGEKFAVARIDKLSNIAKFGDAAPGNPKAQAEEE
jgi:PAS domain S-box-containing protein